MRRRSSAFQGLAVLIPYLETDTEAQAQMAAFRDGLEKLGLAPGRSVQIDERWTAGDFGVLRRAAKELVTLRPDVIISRSTAATAALLYETRTKPVVFLLISDPVGDGFVVSMARPGGHATGFTDLPASMAGKWLELLKEMVPRISRVAVMYGTGTAPGDGLYYLRSIQAEGYSKHVNVIGIRVKNPREIEQDIKGFAREPDGALIVTPDLTTTLYRGTLIDTALRYRVPAMYPFRNVAAEGGLIVLRCRHYRSVSARCGIRRSHPEGRKAARASGAGANQVRAGDKLEDRQGARP